MAVIVIGRRNLLFVVSVAVTAVVPVVSAGHQQVVVVVGGGCGADDGRTRPIADTVHNFTTFAVDIGENMYFDDTRTNKL